MSGDSSIGSDVVGFRDREGVGRDVDCMVLVMLVSVIFLVVLIVLVVLL